jgi:hypothetical protein
MELLCHVSLTFTLVPNMYFHRYTKKDYNDLKEKDYNGCTFANVSLFSKLVLHMFHGSVSQFHAHIGHIG